MAKNDVSKVLCLDTSVCIPYLVPEVYQPQARTLVEEAQGFFEDFYKLPIDYLEISFTVLKTGCVAKSPTIISMPLSRL